jgi:endo-1,3(4)-beta-glucanase
MDSSNFPRKTLGSSPEGAVGENADILATSPTRDSDILTSSSPSHQSLRSSPTEPAWLKEARAQGSSNGLLMFALPHHQELLRSTHKIYTTGCVWTMHGEACPVIGKSWLLQETTRPVKFEATEPYKQEALDILRTSVLEDLNYQIPINYQRGAGDTYFSGKMLAKLARIIEIGDEVSKLTPEDASEVFSKWQSSYQPLHARALEHLTAGVEVWLNGSALAPLAYDESWGGMVGCGCDFDGDTNTCRNVFPNCPALLDAGQNYGSGFYNDHHFHYGYHIFAAAVVIKFDPAWGMKFHESVLALVRDIANPSIADPFFPQWRHKDW